MKPYPLVFVPGLAGHAEEFAAQREHFSPERPVRVVEPFIDGDLAMDGQARRLAEWVIAQRVERCVLVGHSHGGLVALSLAAHRPDLVAGLVLLDAPVLPAKPVRLLAPLPLALLCTRLGPALIRRFFMATFTESDSTPWRCEVLGRLDRVPRDSVRTIVAGTFTYDSATALRSLTIPALYIRANIPTRLDRLPVAVNATRVPGFGHWPHVHAPHEINRLLAAFLVELPVMTVDHAHGQHVS